jgi:type I restriction enzyme R subunit
LTRDDIEPWILSLEEEDRRAIFQARYRAFYKALEQLLPDPRALAYLGDFAWLRRLRREMLAHFSTEDLELPDCSAKVRELINRHVRGEEIRILLDPIPIMSESFTKEVQKLASPRAKASRMEHAISRTISVRLHEDPAFYESVKERLERIINDRRDQRIDDTEEFKLLMCLRGDILKGRHDETASLGVSRDAAPFFGILHRALSDVGAFDGPKLADLAQEVLESLKAHAVIDWQEKEDIQRDMRRRVKRQLRLAGCPSDHIERLTIDVMDLARVRLTK